MGSLQVDISEVKKLVELVESHHLEELTVEEGDLSITIKGRTANPPSAAVTAPRSEAAVEIYENHIEPAVEEVEEIEAGIVDIAAPLVGVFYRSPSPDAPAFVEVGDHIEIGSEIGLIEAMKVFSPIPSEVAGEVVAIPCENGKLVKEGDVLVRVKISEG